MSGTGNPVKLEFGKFIRNIATSLNNMGQKEEGAKASMKAADSSVDEGGVAVLEVPAPATKAFSEKLSRLMDEENRIFGLEAKPYMEANFGKRESEPAQWPSFRANSSQRSRHMKTQDLGRFDEIVAKLMESAKPLNAKASDAAKKPYKVTTRVRSQGKSAGGTSKKSLGIREKIVDAWGGRPPQI